MMKKCPCALSILIATCLLTARGGGMDIARHEAGVDAAVARFGLSGKGVIVATLDRGIDWQHPDFRRSDGTTRIKWIFDLSNDAGAASPENPYGKGTLYTEAQINEALANETSLATRDAQGHGTTTAGIAAGNGRGLPDRRYRGVAPEATLVVVKVVGGAPAHGAEPAEAAFSDRARVLLGMDFVKDKARELGLPCVMIPNLGSIGGPTDGTSDFSRKIDSIVAPGLLMVNGPGDDGGVANRATGNVAKGAVTSLEFKKGQPGNLRVDLWYAAEDYFTLTLVGPAGTYGPYNPPANGSVSTWSQKDLFTLTHLGAGRGFFGAMNGKREVLIDLTGPAGTYSLEMSGTAIGKDGRFDAGMNPATIQQPVASRNSFLSHVFPGNGGNIWDGATAYFNICPGDYVVRTHWTDIDGKLRSSVNQGELGGIWTGSSAGPTYDGRLGVDFCAPGDSLITSYAPRSFWATARSNLIQGGGGIYGRANAVSASAPFAVGVIALMLEMNPNLEAATAKRILQQSARADSFTGVVPNFQWGHGKIDAERALSLTADTLLRISKATRVQDAAHLAFPSVVGKTYRVEVSSDLSNPSQWDLLPGYESIAGTGSEVLVVDPHAASAKRRFYRIAALR